MQNRHKINPDYIKIYRLTDPAGAGEVLNLIKDVYLFYAHEADIALYSRNGGFTLSALNETRGDVIESINNDLVFVAEYQGEFIAHLRCIVDFDSGKCLLTRFVIANPVRNQGIEDLFIDTISQKLRNLGISEAYIYIDMNNNYLMNTFKRENFLPYSINDGIPYPIVCLIKRLYR